MATALILVLMLGTGALFLSLAAVRPETYSLLFGEVYGIAPTCCCRSAILGA